MNNLIEWNQLKDRRLESKSQPGPSELALDALAFSLYPTGAGLELAFYLKLQNALKVLALSVLRKSGLQTHLHRWTSFGSLEDFDPIQIRSFFEFAHQTQIFERRGDLYRLRPCYQNLTLPDAETLLQAGQEKDLVKGPLSRLVEDFIFLATVANGNARTTALTSRWRNALAKNRFDYQLLLTRFLLEISRINLRTKIAFSQPSSFFSDMGQRAFRQFVLPTFKKVLDEVNEFRSPYTVLDVGCGYGDQIEETLARLPQLKTIEGIEIQETVANSTRHRFESRANVKIHLADLFEVEMDARFDLILLNYVTFYFSEDERRLLFDKLKTLLAPNGRILICQYFPDSEELQQALCELKKDFSFSKKLEIFFGVQTRLGEILLDNSLNNFKSIERWDTFLSRTNEQGFQVTHVTNADPFYYSFFIVLQLATE